MKKLSIAVIVIVLLTNCNNNNGWSAADRQTGMKQCTDQVGGRLDDATAKQYCSCVLEKAMQKYSSLAASEKAPDEVGREIGESCLKVIQGGGDDNGGKGKKKGGLFGGGGKDDNGGGGDDNGGGGGNGWSTTDKNAFVNPCTTVLVQQGYTNTKARQLCSCSLEKLQKEYTNLQDANERGGEQAGKTAMQECLNENGSN